MKLEPVDMRTLPQVNVLQLKEGESVTIWD